MAELPITSPSIALETIGPSEPAPPTCATIVCVPVATVTSCCEAIAATVPEDGVARLPVAMLLASIVVAFETSLPRARARAELLSLASVEPVTLPVTVVK